MFRVQFDVLQGLQRQKILLRCGIIFCFQLKRGRRQHQICQFDGFRIWRWGLFLGSWGLFLGNWGLFLRSWGLFLGSWGLSRQKRYYKFVARVSVVGQVSQVFGMPSVSISWSWFAFKLKYSGSPVPKFRGRVLDRTQPGARHPQQQSRLAHLQVCFDVPQIAQERPLHGCGVPGQVFCPENLESRQTAVAAPVLGRWMLEQPRGDRAPRTWIAPAELQTDESPAGG